ncbi:LysR family transcriptional regulator [Amycolatopsis regifaucium]|uniref:LysR family transcriptional regulator n=1 Tax=Amycolatopsis regifaucium TaxID=546365 RepID=A0A154M3G8_9PSEU|nr:LysR family transcriptional regulator [Amycolatopsis regifaucium]KZB79154.1 LysR family transcriptional regulator [Amycolatopsis regifaucium]OKA07822.1 LysR family transcriptional regulator [Amycolatopsis regifaucium]SFH13956.1 DNA-binding transcriptional regulator, LysR family [Amycolatopsis regifaucium]
MDVELRHLRVVCAVADAGSITRAAIGIGSTQPALTAAVQRIERAFGGTLFVRGRGGVVPTAFGERVLAHARTVLAAADTMHRDAARWLAEEQKRPVALGGIGGSMVVELADRLGDSGRAPAVSVTTEFSPLRLLDLVAGGQLDAAVVADYPGHVLPAAPRVALRPLAAQPVFVAIAADHPAAQGTEVELADLAAERWVLGPSDGAGWPECFEEACARAGFRPQVAHRSTELRPLQRLIAAGRAISPCQVTFPASPGIAIRALTGDPLWMRYLIAWHTEGAFGGNSDALLAAAKAAYRSDTDSSHTYRHWLTRRGEPAAVRCAIG